MSPHYPTVELLVVFVFGSVFEDSSELKIIKHSVLIDGRLPIHVVDL